jgi:hypothetical protein
MTKIKKSRKLLRDFNVVVLGFDLYKQTQKSNDEQNLLNKGQFKYQYFL